MKSSTAIGSKQFRVGQSTNSSPRLSTLMKSTAAVLFGGFTATAHAYPNLVSIQSVEPSGQYDEGETVKITALFDDFISTSPTSQMQIELDTGNSSQTLDLIFDSSSLVDQSFGSPGVVNIAGHNTSSGIVMATELKVGSNAGRIAIVGDFTSYEGVAAQGLVILNADGSIYQDVSSIIDNVGGDSTSVYETQAGKIIVGGEFTSANGNSNYKSLVQLNADFSVDTVFMDNLTNTNSNAGFGGGVVGSIANSSDANYYSANTPILEKDNKLWITGNFTSVNGNDMDYLVCLDLDGSLCDVGGGTDNFVSPFSASNGSRSMSLAFDTVSDGAGGTKEVLWVVGGDLTIPGSVSNQDVVRLNYPSVTVDSTYTNNVTAIMLGGIVVLPEVNEGGTGGVALSGRRMNISAASASGLGEQTGVPLLVINDDGTLNDRWKFQGSAFSSNLWSGEAFQIIKNKLFMGVHSYTRHLSVDDVDTHIDGTPSYYSGLDTSSGCASNSKTEDCAISTLFVFDMGDGSINDDFMETVGPRGSFLRTGQGDIHDFELLEDGGLLVTGSFTNFRSRDTSNKDEDSIVKFRFDQLSGIYTVGNVSQDLTPKMTMTSINSYAVTSLFNTSSVDTDAASAFARLDAQNKLFHDSKEHALNRDVYGLADYSNEALLEILEDSASPAGSNNANFNAVTMTELNAVITLNGLNPAHEAKYAAAIAAEDGFNNTPTVPQVQAIIDEVNHVAAVMAEAVSGDGNGSSDILTKLGDAGVNSLDNSAAGLYEAAILGADPEPTTIAELQSIIDDVNTFGNILTQAATGNGAGTSNVVAELVTASVNNTDGDHARFYELAINAASPVPSTTEEFQTIVDDTNLVALAVIEAEAGNGTGGSVANKLSDAGVTGVNPDNAAYYDSAITSASPLPSTKAELQAIIDEADLVAAAVKEASEGKGIPGDVADKLEAAGAVNVNPAFAVTYDAVVGGANPAPATTAELQILVDQANLVATAVAKANEGKGTSGSLDTDLVAAGVTDVISQNAETYDAVISGAIPVPTTTAELQALIAQANLVKVAVDEAEAGNGTGGTVAAKLQAASVNNVDPNNAALYDVAISDAAPEPTTVAELQELINQANRVADAVTEAEAGNGTDGTIANKLELAGVEGVNPDYAATYDAVIDNASPEPLKKDDLQALINQANLVADAVAEANLDKGLEGDVVSKLGLANVSAALTENAYTYDQVIINAAPVPTTTAELQALIDQANLVAAAVAEANTGQGADGNIDNALIDAGVTGTVPANASLYDSAISGASPVPTTTAELQALIDGVNAFATVLLEAEEGQGDGSSDVVNALISATILNTVPENKAVYESAIYEAVPVPTSVLELQEIVDQANIFAEILIEAKTGNGAGTSAVKSKLETASVVRVVDGNKGLYEAAIDSTEPTPLTLTEMQDIVDEVNVVAIVNNTASAGEGNQPSGSQPRIAEELGDAEVVNVQPENADLYQDAIASAAPRATTVEELQAIINEVNFVAEVVALSSEIHELDEASNEQSNLGNLLPESSDMPLINPEQLQEFSALVIRAEPTPTTEAELVALAETLQEHVGEQPPVFYTIKQGTSLETAKTVNAITADGGLVFIIATDPTDPEGLNAPDFAWEETAPEILSLSTEATPVSNVLVLSPETLTPGSSFDVSVNLESGGQSSLADVTISVADMGFDREELVDSDGDGISDIYEGSLEGETNPGALNKLQTTVGDDTSFVMTADEDVMLRLGSIARGASSNQASVTLDDMVEHLDGATHSSVFDGLPHIGDPADVEVFDFEVLKLPYVGYSAEVVIPLKKALQGGASIAKYHVATGWTAFSQDGLNIVYSAPALGGQLGYCPEVTDSAWELGLASGDACIKLVVEDGWVNDADRLAADGSLSGTSGLNGIIVDPSAVVYSDGVTEGPQEPMVYIGGLGFGGLIPLLGLSALQRRRKLQVLH